VCVQNYQREKKKEEEGGRRGEGRGELEEIILVLADKVLDQVWSWKWCLREGSGRRSDYGQSKNDGGLVGAMLAEMER
jgi:hypothetical protein